MCFVETQTVTDMHIHSVKTTKCLFLISTINSQHEWRLFFIRVREGHLLYLLIKDHITSFSSQEKKKSLQRKSGKNHFCQFTNWKWGKVICMSKTDVFNIHCSGVRLAWLSHRRPRESTSCAAASSSLLRKQCIIKVIMINYHSLTICTSA